MGISLHKASHSAEQGIFAKEQGILAQEQGFCLQKTEIVTG
jgi:hypothetical protein